MASRQLYRGNPEIKQYTLFNNFSGGINTTSVDELMMMNEFRDLQNVELIEQGKIQKRKGFQAHTLLNDWIASSASVSKIQDIEQVYYAKVLFDSANIFTRMQAYDSLNDFKVALADVIYNAIVLLVTSKSDGIHFDYLQIFNDPDQDVVHLLTYNDMYTYESNPNIHKKAPITGVEAVVIENQIYFNLYDMIEGLDRDESPMAVRVVMPVGPDSIFDNTPITEIIASNEDADVNIHVPSPYEVSFVGFNLLLNNPLTDIDVDTSGIQEIRGVFLTDINDQNVVLANIPPSGQFTLNIITKGALNEEPIIRFYTEDAQLEQTDLDMEAPIEILNENSAVKSYDINLRIENSRTIFVEIKRQELAILTYEKEFDTVSDMVAWYKNTDAQGNKEFLVPYSGQVTYSYFEPLNDSQYNYQYVSLPGFSGDYTVLEKAAVSLPRVNLYYLQGYPVIRSDSPVHPGYANTNQHVIFYKYQNNSTQQIINRVIGVVKFDANGQVIYSSLSANDENIYPDSNAIYFETIPNLVLNNEFFKQEIDILKVIKINTTTPAYYRWNEGNTGTNTDFDTVPDDEAFVDVYNFVNFYDVKLEDKPRQVKPIDLQDTQMIAFQNRLLLYKQNVLIFSDLFNYTYFPNYNYIALPLESDDFIQKIAYFRGSHIIFTRDKLYRMSGTFGQSDFAIVLINDSIGCVAPQSVRSMNNNLIFMARDGLYHIKQAYFQEGLENVDKVDKNIQGLIPYGENYEAFTYNEQYLLLVKDYQGNYTKTVKQYYNMEYARKTFPYVIDVYSVDPDTNIQPFSNIVRVGTEMFSFNLEDKLFYIYNKGYTDFGNNYDMVIETPNYMLGYPTHDKKFKNLFIKSKAQTKHPVYITVYLEDNEVISPYQWITDTDGNTGEITYTPQPVESIVTGGTTYVVGGSENEITETSENSDITYSSDQTSTTLDNKQKFTVGIDYLGGKETVIHKFVLSQKGKYIRLKIVQQDNGPIAFQDFGILFKLGKVKEG